ncbi:MAG: hypothetical protein IKJ30_01415 [Bacilli bacterium]|nr:hypothetical protein [Bacilli bacterium]
MKIVIQINLPETTSKTIYLDEDVFYIEEEGNKVSLNSSYENRFNTLLGLFSCKSTWKDMDLEDSIYNVTFIDEKEETFTFSKAPGNWNMFMAYIDKLVGDSL